MNRSQSEEDHEELFPGNDDKIIKDSLDVDLSTESMLEKYQSNHMGGDQEEILDEARLQRI